MSSLPKQRMTVDEFLVWAEGRPGRYELENGEVIAMSPEVLRHSRAKGRAFNALQNAARAGRLPCEALPDGATVRIGRDIAYEPDALLYCGERLSDNVMEVPQPVVLVEVLSPFTGSVDKMRKLPTYFSLPSVRHYLIVDAEKRLLIHYARSAGDLVETRFLSGGLLRLDPPGLDLTVEEFFPEE